VDEQFVNLLRPFLAFAQGQQIGEDAKLRDLGLDSMQSIQLLFAIEDEYGVTLPDELLNDATFETAGSLWRAVADQLPTDAQVQTQ
jgi:acyl carrier protein